MIVLLRSGRDVAATPIDPALADCGPVQVVRAPRPPKRGKQAPAGVLWADRALLALSHRIADGEVTAVVCGDDRSAPFSWQVAERHPQTPVLNGVATAARILSLLQARDEPWTTTAVRRLLDSGRRPWPELPAYLIDPAARPPLLVTLVAGSVRSNARAVRMATSAADAGYDSVIVGDAPAGEPDGDYLILGRVLALRLGAPGGSTKHEVTSAEGMPPRWDRLKRYSRRLRRESPAVESSQSSPGGIGDSDELLRTLLTLRPAVIHVHDEGLLAPARHARRLLRKAGHAVKLVGDAAPGETWADSLDAATTSAPDARVGAPDRSVLALPDGASAGGRPASDARSDSGVAEGEHLIVLRGVDEQGLAVALRTLIHVPDAHLAVLPDEEVNSRPLIRAARKAGVADRFSVLDPVRLDEVVAYLTGATAGLVTDASQYPVAVHEFAAAGVPLVAVDPPGEIATMIEEQGIGAVIVDPKPRQIAHALPDLTGPGAPTSSPASDHLWDRQGDDLVRLYATLVGPPPLPPGGAASVLIGATNSAGQGTAWARALAAAGVSARSLELRSPENPFEYPADVVLPRQSVKDLQRRVQVMFREVLPHPVIILESAQAMASPEPGGITGRRAGFREAEALRAAGHTVGLIFHGSDIRRPDIHARTHRWSPFHLREAADLTREQSLRVRRTHEFLAAWSGPVMVSTPDLVQQQPGAVWVPVVIDLTQFHPADPPHGRSDGPPVVLHLPSKSLFKGSHYIDPVLRELAAEGVITYRRATGVPHHRVPELMRDADIFVDQLGMGILGVAALEAMASGVPVVTDPGPEALRAYGEDVPIVAVDADTIAAAIRALAADPQRRRELAEAGPDFVRRHHDGRRSAEAIIDALGLAVPSRP